jgi:phospholipase C
MRFSQRWQHTRVMVMAVATVVVLGAWVRASEAGATTTPIEHLIVIFQEKVSFDHYFATYPSAANPPNDPVFEAKPGTPSVNGLTGSLLTHNPNATPPFRLERAQAVTCDQNHEYLAEQQAFNAGLMDKFVEFTGVGSTPANPCADYDFGPSLVMGDFDGNTFLLETLNRLQRLPEWERTAVIVAYDDSNGWYDRVMGPIVSQSSTSEDGLTGCRQLRHRRSR